MLEVNNLHVSYGAVNAVRGVTMSASAGRITLVLGSNGAGKTTSLRAIHGLLKAKSGSVKLNGKEILGQSAHRQVRQGVVMVPEGRRIFASLTVEENLRMGAYTVSRAAAQRTRCRGLREVPHPAGTKSDARRAAQRRRAANAGLWPRHDGAAKGGPAR